MSSLKHIDKIKLEKIFNMNKGYVCNFSDRTFGDFILESTGVDVYTDEYSKDGTSKANRLRTFWKKESNELTARLIEALLEYWRTTNLISGKDVQLTDQNLYLEGLKIVKGLSKKDFEKDHSYQQIGIINEGEGTYFEDVDTEGFDIGIKNTGNKTTIIGGKHISKKVLPTKTPNLLEKITNNQTFAVAIGSLIFLLIIYLIYMISGVNLSNPN
jgi:hypothetical protein